jgi:hypothetical protein
VAVGLHQEVGVWHHQYRSGGERAEGDPGRYIKIDHAGRNGFATTWTLTDKGGDTSVEVHTWVDPPPWPLTKMYMNQVRPAWKSCHQGLLDNLARKVQSKP